MLAVPISVTSALRDANSLALLTVTHLRFLCTPFMSQPFLLQPCTHSPPLATCFSDSSFIPNPQHFFLPSTTLALEYRNSRPQMSFFGTKSQAASHRTSHKLPRSQWKHCQCAYPGSDSLTRLSVQHRPPQQVNNTFPLPSQEEFHVSHLHCSPPCMLAVSFQITADLLEVSLRAVEELKKEIKKK